MIRLGTLLGWVGTSLTPAAMASVRTTRDLSLEPANSAPSPRVAFERAGLLDLQTMGEGQVARFLLNRASVWNFRRLALVDHRLIQSDPKQQVLYAASLGDVFGAVADEKRSTASLERALRQIGCDRDVVAFARDYVTERSKMVTEGLNLRTREERRRLASEFLEIALHARQEVGVALFLARSLASLSGLDWRRLVLERQERTADYERELISWVREEGGTVPFNRFFEHAMFNPRAGTYTGKTAASLISPDPSASPDSFFTTSSTDPVLAKSLLSYARGVWERMGAPEVFDLVEMGAGMGSLAEAILQRVSEWPESDRFGSAVRYTIVEKSSALAHLQEARLERFGRRAVVLCRSAIRGRLPHVATGMFFSNELLDMFPPRKVVNAGGSLQEACISHRGGLFQEVSGPLCEETRGFLEERGIRLNHGETYYIQPDIDRWVASLAEALGSGAVVTIDYGDKRDILRKSRHEFGRSIFRGFLRRSDPKIDFGLISYLSYRDSPTGVARPKDMTVDVDFTTLEEAVRKAGGLRQRDFMNQREFCLKYGGEKPKIRGFDDCWVSILSKGV